MSPIPVTERIPTAAAADAEGCVWVYSVNSETWGRVGYEWTHSLPIGFSHWLPGDALPVPERTSWSSSGIHDEVIGRGLDSAAYTGREDSWPAGPVFSPDDSPTTDEEESQ